MNAHHPQRFAPGAREISAAGRAQGAGHGAADAPSPDDRRRADALHALGRLYLTQGFPKQGLALLMAAQDFAPRDARLARTLAYGYVVSGAPRQALETLDRLTPALTDEGDRRAAAYLRGRALLALGRDVEARAAFGASTETNRGARR